MRILAFVLSGAIALAQAQTTTTITGPVVDAFGNPYTGSITIQSQARTATGFAITGTSRTVPVTNGAIIGLTLVPNDISIPNPTSYRAVFANNDIWMCIVPPSPTPVAWTMACTTPPNTGQAIPFSQIIPCPADGNVIGTVSGITSCLPGVPAAPPSGNWCLQSMDGAAPVWIRCSPYTTWDSLPISMLWSGLTGEWIDQFSLK